MKAADRKSSRPEGWLPAGAKVHIRLTIKQEAYCRRAHGIRRFCYNLARRHQQVPPLQPDAMNFMAGHLQGFQSLQIRGLPLRHRSGFPCRRGRLHGLRSSHHQLAQPRSESPRSHVHQAQGHRRGRSSSSRRSIGARDFDYWETVLSHWPQLMRSALSRLGPHGEGQKAKARRNEE